MIPNTDINCSKCATPMYSDCVMWSGGDLSCLALTKDCCDTSITDVINKLGGYICNFSNVTDYMFPFCFESYSISDFHGMQQAMLTQICVLQSEIDTLEAKVGPLDFNWGCYSSGVTSSVTLAIQRLITETCTKLTPSLTWGCITSGTTNSINASLQALINAQNSQQISYNTSDFVVTGETGLCNKGLSLKRGQWTQIDSRDCVFFNGFSVASTLYYFKDTLGFIHLRGQISTTNVINLAGTTGGSGTPSSPYTVLNSSNITYTYAGGGPSIPVMDLPAYLSGASGVILYSGVAAGFGPNTYIRGAAVTQYYNLRWSIIMANVDATSVPACTTSTTTGVRINAYVPYEATQGSGSVSLYLYNVSYSTN